MRLLEFGESIIWIRQRLRHKVRDNTGEERVLQVFGSEKRASFLYNKKCAGKGRTEGRADTACSARGQEVAALVLGFLVEIRPKYLVLNHVDGSRCPVREERGDVNDGAFRSDAQA